MDVHHSVCLGLASSRPTHRHAEAPYAGINSRALHTLFEVASAEGRRRPVSLSVAFLEVYNEAVRDLLVRDSGALEVSGIPAGQLPEGATAAPLP